MQTIKPNYEEENKIEKEKNIELGRSLIKSNIKGCFVSLIVVAIIIGAAALIYYFVNVKSNDNNPYNEEKPGIFERSASLNDLTITGDDFNISSLGEVLTFNPKYDINNLTLTFEFVNGKKVVQTIKRKVGNVVKGKQYKVTISIADLSWDVIKNAFNIKCRYYVSSGTTMVFN